MASQSPQETSPTAPFPRQQLSSTPPPPPYTPGTPYKSNYSKTVTFVENPYTPSKKITVNEGPSFSTPTHQPTTSRQPFADVSPGMVVIPVAPPGLHTKGDVDRIVSYPYDSKLLLWDICVFVAWVAVLINLTAIGNIQSMEGTVAIVILVAGSLVLLTSLWFTQRRTVLFHRLSNVVVVINRRLLIPFCGDTEIQRVAFTDLLHPGCTGGVGVEGILYLETCVGRIDLGVRNYTQQRELLNDSQAWQSYLDSLRLQPRAVE